MNTQWGVSLGEVPGTALKWLLQEWNMPCASALSTAELIAPGAVLSWEGCLAFKSWARLCTWSHVVTTACPPLEHRDCMAAWNHLLRKLCFAWGFLSWVLSKYWLKQTFRGMFSSIGTSGSWGRVALISGGNCSFWGSLGIAKGLLYIFWSVLKEWITFYSWEGQPFQ